MIKIIFASVLLAFPALAQTEPSDFVRIGQMDVVIDGNQLFSRLAPFARVANLSLMSLMKKAKLSLV